MPYEDGTLVRVVYDHLTHDSPRAKMYDLAAVNASPRTPARVVAAAPGRVRYIQDCYDKHSCDCMMELGNCMSDPPICRNNFVWIEHVDYRRSCDQGTCSEWTVYAHLVKDSVRGDAKLSIDEWVDAGDFIGLESDVGCVDIGVHLHWMVAVLPSYVGPSVNGDYENHVDVTGERPEITPIVCHRDGLSVMYQGRTYTAGGCSAAASWPGDQVALEEELPNTAPLEAVIQRISRVSDEGIQIAMADSALMRRSQDLIVRLEPTFQNLLRLGRGAMSAVELDLLLGLLDEYEVRGSTEMGRVLASLRSQLESPRERAMLGLIVDPPFSGLD